MTDDISIHALREEGDFPFSSRQTCFIQFLSTPSARRATGFNQVPRLDITHFYPRPPRGGRQRATKSPRSNQSISIHALREEGDLDSWHYGDNYTISIHALREEGDNQCDGKIYRIEKFLSTPSARRATQARQSSRPESTYFYPRPPRGGRPLTSRLSDLEQQISIHALREEGDLIDQAATALKAQFLSTPSARRAT